MSTREILTLQFGHYSNYIGAHWWNTQEHSFEYNAKNPSEINHDVLYREGLTDKGHVTYTPRLLLVDLKGSLKSLPERGDLYEPSRHEPDALWEHEVDAKVEPKVAGSRYREALEDASAVACDAGDDVEVWSDYLYARFHPRTINVVKEYEFRNERVPFDVFSQGSGLWSTATFRDDYCDRARNYLEECDNFQGFQVLFDSTDAFSGLASSCIEYLRDEYENKSVFGVPVIPSYYEGGTDGPEGLLKVVNLAMCYASLSEHCSIFAPLCTGVDGWRAPGDGRKFNHVDYSSESWFHTSSILSAAMDTLSLSYRKRNCAYTLSDLAVDLTLYGRKAVATSLCFPFSLNQDADLIDCLDNWEGPLSQSITPSCNIGTSRLMQLIVLRGVGEDRLKRPPAQAGKQKDMPAYRCTSIAEMLRMYYSFAHDATATNAVSVEKAMSTQKPFPSFFDDRLGLNGNVIHGSRTKGVDVQSVPVLAGLHTGAEVGGMFESLQGQIKRVKFGKLHQYSKSGLEKDEFNESVEKLIDLKECYEDNYMI